MRTLRILVPLDQTPTSVNALASARGLAATVDVCTIELLHALQAEPLSGKDARMAQAEGFLADQAQAIMGPHIATAWKVAEGDPADAVLARVRATHFDFICMSTRAVPNNTGQPGSVAARLFTDSPVPIIALPAGAAAGDDAARHAERAFYRAAVYLPAELEVEGIKHPLHVVVRDLSAKGAELELDSEEALSPKGNLLILGLPTRPEPFEIATTIVAESRTTDDTGHIAQLLHVTFPAIRIAEQDAIVAFLNQLRMFEQQQRRVTAPARVEVITGPRAYANFKGRTTVVRPDYVWLTMDRFDHIEGADVGLRVASADGRATVEVDAAVTQVKPVGSAFEVELEISETAVASAHHESAGERLMGFLRQHYPQGDTPPEEGAETHPLIPRPLRVKHSEPAVLRLLTSAPHEATVPTRAPKAGVEVPLRKRARDAGTRALDSVLRPPRNAPPIRSI
ncbi:MAG TPA: universal stress protein [Chloroflexota bacterium]|nr:universal stress protein [Chloroflexota bacterium]